MSIRLKYTIIYLFCLAALILGLFFSLPLLPLIALIALLLLAAFTLNQIELLALPGWNILWSFVILSGIIFLTHSIIYFFYKSTQITILLSVLPPTALALYVLKDKKINLVKLHQLKAKIKKIFCQNITQISKTDWLFLAILVLQLILYLKTRQKATFDALGSPWPLFGPRFFVLYAINTTAIVWYAFKSKSELLWLIAAVFQFLLSFNIITAVYPLGWGYDPFLHRATEIYIHQFGAALPKTPFYIGQFAIVNTIAHLTGWAIKTIDIYLVPILAGILLPLSAYFGLRHGLRLKKNALRLATLAILLYPLSSFVATTPHNLANLFTLVSIFLSLLLLQGNKYWPLPSIFSALAMATHPLTGIFSVVMLLALMAHNHANKISGKIFIIFLFTASSVMVPFFFWIYSLVGGMEIQFSLNSQAFFNLFSEPYYFINRPAHFIYDLVYAYRFFLPGILISLALLVFLKKQYRHAKIMYFPLVSLSIMINILIINSMIKFVNLNAFEQSHYAERLLHSTLFFILPLSSLGLVRLVEYTKKISNSLLLLILSVLILALTASFYLTYPQKNPIAHFPGYNITKADYSAAKLIKNLNREQNYVVLSNIMTAAAAIETYGFETYFNSTQGPLFYYAIPSGGPLAELYSNMLYHEQKRQYMYQAMDLTQAKKAYFVVNSYWHKSMEIIQGAKQTADKYWSIDDKIWIFEYKR